MPISCDEMMQRLSIGRLVRACDPLPNRDVLRVQTIFRYPGGEYVDLFCRRGNRGLEFSDFGQSITHLLSMGVDADSSEKRRSNITDVCHELRVTRIDSELTVEFGEEPEGLFDAFVRLSQACVRVADLYLTHRTRMLSAFADDLSEGLESMGLPVATSVALTGQGGRRINLDYVVQGPSRDSGILALSAQNAARAHNVASDAFTKWFDLLVYQPDYQFITVIDSQKLSQFRKDDIDRLEVYSSVLEYPEQADDLRDLLAA